MPNKRTGEDYLDRKSKSIKRVKTTAVPIKTRSYKLEKDDNFGGYNLTKKEAERIRNATPQMQGKNIKNAVLKGKPGKIKPIGTAKGKAKLTPLKKKKK